MIVIIERMLHLVNGHEHSQIKAIRGFIPGKPVEVMASTEFTQTAAFENDVIHSILSTHKDMKVSAQNAVLSDISVIEGFLRKQDKTVSALVIPSGLPHEIRMAIGIAELANAPRIVIRILRPETVQALTPDELTALRRLGQSGQLSLHTETVELSNHLQDEFQLPSTDNFLLPCTIQPDSKRFNEGASRTEGSSFRIGYLGNRRREKGAHQLYGILSELVRQLKAAPGDRHIELLLQRPFSRRFKLSNSLYMARLKAIEKFAGHKGRLRLTWYTGNLTEDEFRDMIHSVDVALVPYELTSYQYRGSGIVIDSVLAGVPIIHTAGIGMAGFLRPGNAIAATSEAEFATAIRDIAQDRGRFDQTLVESRNALLSELDRTGALLNALY